MSDFERYHYAFDPEGDELAARLIRRLPERGTVLELGPGPGVMTKVMIDKGYQVTAVEIDPGSAEIVRGMGAETIVANLEELEWLEAVADKRIIHSRQHYLRFNLPHTFRRLIEAGIQKEFSMGYGTINGFRASVCSSFYWYDLEKEQCTSLLI